MDGSGTRDGHERLTLLARMTSLFSAGLDREATLKSLAQLFVPDFSAFASIDVLEGDEFRRVGSASIHLPAYEEVLRELRSHPRPFGDPVNQRLMRSERATLVQVEAPHQFPWPPRSTEHDALYRLMLPLSVIIAPLRARGAALGLLQVVSIRGERRYTEDDVLLVEDVAQRASFAVHNAHLIADLQRELELRQVATQQLQESELRYRRIFEGSPYPLWVFDLETHRFLAVNEAAVQQYGYSREEFLGLSIHDIRPREDVPFLLEALSRPDNGVRFSGVFRHRRRDGSLILAEIRSHEVEFFGRRARLVQALDVTDRVRAHDALRVAEERHRLVARVTKEAIWEWNPHTDALDWNPAFFELFRHGRDTIDPTRTWFETQVHPDDREEAALIMSEALRHRREDFSRRFRFRRGDGSFALVEDRAIIAYNGDAAERVIGSLSDVTVQHHLDEQLAIAQRMEAVGRLAGGVAHDFNNLLTAIRGFASFALDEQLPASRARDDIEQILHASDRAAALTRQLLAFSRRQVLLPQLVDVNESLGSLQRMLARVLGEDVEVQTFLDPSAARVLVDPGQFEQVIMNLVVNARDAMPDGGLLTIETSNVHLDSAYTESHVDASVGDHVAIAITDTGAGMDPRTMARIFEPFFSTKDRDKGTGLGLATTYGIVKQSGGHIWVYSEPGKGSTFKVYLPRAVDELPGTGVPSLESPGSVDGTEIVLVVEDDDRVRRVSTSALQRHGYRVLEARSAEVALSIFREHQDEIDIVVSDVVLPRMSGPLLVQALRVMRSNLPVLFVSGYTENAFLQAGALSQGSELLEKPFAPGALVRRVRAVLDRARTA